MIRTRRSLAALAMVGSLLLAACGDDASDEPNEPETSESSETTAEAAPEGSPLRIGLLVNVSGAVVTGEKNTPAVMEAWARSVNADGGVAGRPVEIVVEDTQGDPTTATAAATRLAEDESIVGLVMFDSAVEGVYAEAVADAGLPVIGGVGYNPEVWNALPNWYSVATSFGSIINGSFVLAESLGATRVGYAVCAEFPTCAGIGSLAEASAEALGLNYVSTPRLSASQPDFTAECLQANDSGLEYLVLGHSATTGLRFAGDCQTQGFTGYLSMGNGTVEPAVFHEHDPGATIHVLITSFPWWVDDEPVEAYRHVMEGEDVPEEVWADPHSTAAYATMELFKKTLENQAASLPEQVTRDDIVRAYGTVRDETLDGLLPQPISFTAGQPSPTVTCYWFARFEDGVFSGAELDEPVCDPPELQQQ